MRWYGATGLSWSIFVVALAASSARAADPVDERSKADAAARNLYGTIQPSLQNGKTFATTVLAPVVNASEMSSLDGRSKFTPGKTFAAGSQVVLRVGVFPNPSTGDIKSITVEQDLALSGQIDTVSVYPSSSNGEMIAGVCLDGFIQCPPNTYSNNTCSFWKWGTVPNSPGQITANSALVQPGGTLSPYSVNNLSGCYCINSYCSQHNSTTVTNVDGLAGEVGGALAALVMSGKQGIAISKGSVTGGVASYYGRMVETPSNSSTATTASTPPYATNNTATLQSYYTNVGGSDVAADAELKAQNANPASVLNTYRSLADRTGASSTYQRSCVNSREGSLVYQTITQSAEQGISSPLIAGVDHDYYARLHMSSETDLVMAASYCAGGSCRGSIHEQCKISLTLPEPETSIDLRTVTAKMSLVGTGCFATNGSTTWTTGMATDPKSKDVAKWPFVGGGDGICPASGTQYPAVTCQITATFMSQTYKEVESLGCAMLENDPACRLRDEDDDGRKVVSDYIPQSGAQVSQVCRELPGQVRPVKKCRDWWKQEKTFVCKKGGNGTDYSNAFESFRGKVKETQQSATITAPGEMSWVENGVQKTGHVYRYDGGDNECQKACKVKVPTSKTKITTAGSVSDIDTSSQLLAASYTYSYRNCVGAQMDACPIEPDEILTKDCACLNNFQEAAKAISAVDAAASDTICSKKKAPVK